MLQLVCETMTFYLAFDQWPLKMWNSPKKCSYRLRFMWQTEYEPTANLNMLNRCSYECFMRQYNLFSCNFHVQASKQHIFSIYDSFMTCFVCSLLFYSFKLHVFVVGAKFNHIENRFFSTYFFGLREEQFGHKVAIFIFMQMFEH